MKRADRNRARKIAGHRTPASCACLLNAGGPSRRTGRWNRFVRAELLWPRRAENRVAASPLVLLTLLLLFAPIASAREDIHLTCTPRTFHVVPGQPVRLRLTVESRAADLIRLHVPADPQLVLRAVEKMPVLRTPAGVIVRKRVIIWQAVEPGTVTVDAISVETQGRKKLFPKVTITVSDPGT